MCIRDRATLFFMEYVVMDMKDEYESYMYMNECVYVLHRMWMKDTMDMYMNMS